MTEGSNPEAAPVKRVDRELAAGEWKTILDKAWAAGIPHVVFTGGEPTMRPDLPELISYAEANGQVSGLLSDGLRLVDSDYFNTLLQTGLDHLTLILQADNPLSWQAIEAALPADIFLVVHLTLTPMNISTAAGWLDRLAELGVKTISLSTSTVDLGDALAALRDQAAARQLELVWNLPVPYSILNPVRLEIEPDERPQGAGRAWLYVEPDGDVLPAQDINQVLGNFLRDPWEKIWQGQPG
jgi:MoaA/NifB/PqqE/SkfB family radical SAM enzyme